MKERIVRTKSLVIHLCVSGLGLLLGLSACSEDGADNRGSGGAVTGGSSSGTGGAPPSGGAGGSSTGGSNGGTAGSDGGAAGSAGASGAPGDPGMCTEDVSTTSSGLNHMHELVIPLEDIAWSRDKVFETAESTGHTHWVALTAADFTTLKEGGEVTKRSCSGQDHQYVLKCGADPTEPILPEDCGASVCGSMMISPCE